MTICDNLILMYRGLYQYHHVLLKWREELQQSPESGTVPERKLGSSPASGCGSLQIYKY